MEGQPLRLPRPGAGTRLPLQSCLAFWGVPISGRGSPMLESSLPAPPQQLRGRREAPTGGKLLIFIPESQFKTVNHSPPAS